MKRPVRSLFTRAFAFALELHVNFFEIFNKLLKILYVALKLLTALAYDFVSSQDVFPIQPSNNRAKAFLISLVSFSFSRLHDKERKIICK